MDRGIEALRQQLAGRPHTNKELFTEFIRVFLSPSENACYDINALQLANYAERWYSTKVRHDAGFSEAEIIQYMQDMYFTKYERAGATYFNLNSTEVATIKTVCI